MVREVPNSDMTQLNDYPPLCVIGGASHFVTLERKHLELWEESYTFLTD